MRGIHTGDITTQPAPVLITDIDRRVSATEMEAAYDAARKAGLGRFDGRA